jgi:hypothetical protein
MVDIVLVSKAGWKPGKAEPGEERIERDGIEWVYVGMYRHGIVGSGDRMGRGPATHEPAYIPVDPLLRMEGWAYRLGVPESAADEASPLRGKP